MKFYDTHFDDYIETNKVCDLHPKLELLYKNFPNNIHDFRNLIFYGPKGVGKYTQMLQIIKPYSPSQLKVEKRLTINTSTTFYIKMSDILIF